MTMRYRAPWDYQQANEAKKLREKGLSDEEIGYAMGRTSEGVRKALYHFFGANRQEPVDRYTVGPPIGLTIECKRLRNDAIGGSQALASSIMALLNRMPASAALAVLGPPASPPVPGTEKALKTSAVERLAA
jgi:hypothetical protein